MPDHECKQSLVFARILTAFSHPPSEYYLLRRSINFWASMYIVMAGVVLIFWLAQGYIFSYTTEKLDMRAKERCFRSMMEQDIEFYDDGHHGTGTLIDILEASTKNLKNMSGAVIGSVLTFLATILGGIILSIAIGWKLALICTVTIPVVAACGWI